MIPQSGLQAWTGSCKQEQAAEAGGGMGSPETPVTAAGEKYGERYLDWELVEHSLTPSGPHSLWAAIGQPGLKQYHLKE